jgi:hypothetical protein
VTLKARTDISLTDSRSRAKGFSRLADSAAVEQGLKTRRDVKRENEILAPFAAGARIDPNASRRLA